MTQAKHYIPDGKRSITPYLVVKGASRLIDFLKSAFGADAYLTVPNPDGTIGHAEVKVDDSVIIGDRVPAFVIRSATSGGSRPGGRPDP